MPEVIERRGLAHSGRPGDMLEFYHIWRKAGFARAFNEFLDEFYTCPVQSALDAEPPHGLDPEFRAFLAAVVESLALDWDFEVPEWCHRDNAKLEVPICWELFRNGSNYHPEDRERIATLVARDTPTVFRQHGIHVRANVLKRV
jgi:hypothetical protein